MPVRKKKRKEKEIKASTYFPKRHLSKRESWYKGVPKIFRIRNHFSHTYTSRSKCMTCISLWFNFWLSNICDASMLTLPTQNSTQSFSGRLWKEGKFKMPLVRYDTHWAIERIIWGTYIYFAKLIKPLDRWLIKDQMIGDSVITIPSCNHPRTWKSKKPYKYQGKGWI
jgi:hypothetical protein